jgi:predicted nucleotidyltransferase
MPPVDHMKTSLDHLPAKKVRELARIQEILFEEFRTAVAANAPDIKKPAEILKIVLFGSYARGDWVDEREKLPEGYQSDFDLLVVVSHKALAEMETYWYPAEERLLRRGADATPFSLIVHSLGEVNEALERGRYFFLDIVRDGIALYEKPGHPFRKPKPLTPEAALEEAEEAFAKWLPMADGFLRHFKSDLEEGQLNLGAFQLHQAAESLCTAYLLVKTFYVPKTHNLNKLRGLVEAEDSRFREV